MVFPCFRLFLLGRVGPAVAVMKVDHHPHAPLLCPHSHSDCFFHTAMTTGFISRRIYKSPQADGVDPVILQYFKAIFFNSLIVEEFITCSFHLWQPTDISSFSKN